MSMEMNFYYAVMLLLISPFKIVIQVFMEVFYQEWGPELCFLLLIYEFYLENICKKLMELIIQWLQAWLRTPSHTFNF